MTNHVVPSSEHPRLQRLRCKCGGFSADDKEILSNGSPKEMFGPAHDWYDEPVIHLYQLWIERAGSSKDVDDIPRYDSRGIHVLQSRDGKTCIAEQRG